MNGSAASVAIPVSLAELRASIAEVAISGQVGEPVNVRLHWDVADNSIELPDAILAAATLADAALQLTGTRWTVRRASQGRLLNVLGVDDRGRTTLLSASYSVLDRVSLTVFGNHGVARIEQAQLADKLPFEIEGRPIWEQSLRLATNAATSSTPS
ncbi:hypothetical protein GC176_10405 [bacterium]|nr:hypothetical protein [bacterium]